MVVFSNDNPHKFLQRVFVLALLSILSACNSGDKTNFDAVDWNKSLADIFSATANPNTGPVSDEVIVIDSERPTANVAISQYGSRDIEITLPENVLYDVTFLTKTSGVSVFVVKKDHITDISFSTYPATFEQIAISADKKYTLPLPSKSESRFLISIRSTVDTSVDVNLENKRPLTLIELTQSIGCTQCHGISKSINGRPLTLLSYMINDKTCTFGCGYYSPHLMGIRYSHSFSDENWLDKLPAPFRSDFYLEQAQFLFESNSFAQLSVNLSANKSAQVIETNIDNVAIINFSGYAEIKNDYELHFSVVEGDPDLYFYDNVDNKLAIVDDDKTEFSRRFTTRGQQKNFVVMVASTDKAKFRVELREISPEPVALLPQNSHLIPWTCYRCHENYEFSNSPSWNDLSKRYQNDSNPVDKLWQVFNNFSDKNWPYPPVSISDHSLDNTNAYDINRLFASIAAMDSTPDLTAVPLTLENPKSESISENRYRSFVFTAPSTGRYVVWRDELTSPSYHELISMRILSTDNYAKKPLIIAARALTDDPTHIQFDAIQNQKIEIEVYSRTRQNVRLNVQKLADPNLNSVEIFSKLKQYSCDTCHQFSDGKLAPSWYEIFNRYKSEPNATITLTNSIKYGNTANWSSRAFSTVMPARPITMSDDDIALTVNKLIQLDTPETAVYNTSVTPSTLEGTALDPGNVTRAVINSYQSTALNVVSMKGDADVFLYEKQNFYSRKLVDVSYSRSAVDEIIMLAAANSQYEVVMSGFESSQARITSSSYPKNVFSTPIIEVAGCKSCHMFRYTVSTPSLLQIANTHPNNSESLINLTNFLQSEVGLYRHSSISDFSEKTLKEGIQSILDLPRFNVDNPVELSTNESQTRVLTAGQTETFRVRDATGGKYQFAISGENTNNLYVYTFNLDEKGVRQWFPISLLNTRTITAGVDYYFGILADKSGQYQLTISVAP